MNKAKRYLSDHKHVLVAFFCLLTVHLIFGRGRNTPINMPDELGYLANAATFAGYSWSNIAAGMPYYGVGYSLLLTPFFMMFQSPFVIYTAVMILNTILISGIVFIIYSLNDHWLPNASKTVKLLIAVCVCLYPSYVIYSKVAMSESVLYCLFWVSVWLISRLERKNTGTALLLGVVMGFSYMVHYRMMAVIIASFATLILMAWSGKIRKTAIVYYLAGLIPMVFLESLIHGYIIENLHNGNAAITNTLSGSSGKINELMRLDQVGQFITTAIGQSYYLMAASYLLVLLGFFFSLIIVFKALTHKGEEVFGDLNIDAFSPVVFYMLLSFVFMLGISVVMFYTSVGARGDLMLYGRYCEAVSVGLLYMGLIAPVLLGERSRGFRNICTLSVATFASVSLYMIIFAQELMNAAETCAPINMTSLIPYLNVDLRIDFLPVSAIVVTISILCMLIQRYRFKISLIYYCTIFLLVAYLNMANFIQPSTDYVSDFVEMQKVLRTITTEVEVDVYYYLSGDSGNTWRVGRYYQTAIPEIALQVVEDWETVSSGDYYGYIIGPVEDDGLSQLPGAELIYANDAGTIWANFENETDQ